MKGKTSDVSLSETVSVSSPNREHFKLWYKTHFPKNGIITNFINYLLRGNFNFDFCWVNVKWNFYSIDFCTEDRKIKGQLRAHIFHGEEMDIITRLFIDSEKMFDKWSKCCLQIDLPKNEKEYDFLKMCMEFLVSKKGMDFSNEFGWINKYPENINDFFDKIWYA